MENASKALIIAGAILLSILLISLGIGVFQQAKNNSGTSDLDAQQIQTFNADWESYTSGTHTAAQVKDMINKLIAHNTSEKNNESNNYINLTFDPTPQESYASIDEFDPSNFRAQIKPNMDELKNSARYKVTVYYAASGLVCSMNVATAS